MGDSPDCSRSYVKRDREDRLERGRDDEEWEASDERRHGSSKSKTRNNAEETEGQDSKARRRSSKDRGDNKRRSGGSSRADSDEDDYDARKGLRSKQGKRKHDESSLEKLSSWYQDGELQNRQDVENSGSRGHVRSDESDRRKNTSKGSEHESARSGSKRKEEKSYDGEKTLDRETRYSEKKESTREKVHGSSESAKNPRRRWDEADTNRKPDDNYYETFDLRNGINSDSKYESIRERSSRNEPIETEKASNSNNRDERSRIKGRPETLEEDDRGSPNDHEDRYGRGKSDKHKQRSSSGQDPTESQNRSRTPEKTGRRYQETDHIEMDYERSGEKDPDLREHRRRRQPNDKDSKDGDPSYDRGREWELPRRSRDRSDNDRLHLRPGNRKDGIRGEAVKTSSNFGISNENYDVIEIQTKPLNYGRGTSQRPDLLGSVPSSEDLNNFMDEGAFKGDLNAWRDETDYRAPRPGQSLGGAPQPPFGHDDMGSFGRGMKGNRPGRGGRGRPGGRDGQQVGPLLPILGPHFGPLGMPPLTPGMSPAPGPLISPGVLIPPFSPIVWPRGVDMNMFNSPNLSHVPPGPGGPRFPSNMGNPTNPSMFFNQSGPGREGPPSISGPAGSNASSQIGSGTHPDRTPGGWTPRNGPAGKAPSRGEQNDYSQNFVDTGMRPQNFIRELELTHVVEDYPKLRELIQKKDEIVANSASAPMYYKCDLREFELSPEFFGTKFDVILVDPPWEEYVHRAPGVTDHMESWTFEEIQNLKIEAIADTPSFIFLWVGDGVGLEQGRQCLKKWGFRRCEDICWVKTNKSTATPGLRHDSLTLFQHSKEHCLMGIKGTVRRSTDGHIIHANIDTDVIIAEEPPYGSTRKPEDMYRIIEHFSLGRRRLELFGEEHNIRSGWLTVGNELSSSNFDAKTYVRNFADKDGKVWQGGGGRNPPPDAPHLVVTTPDIEGLRPKSPMRNQQQMQEQSPSISLTSGNPNRRPSINELQNANINSFNQDVSGGSNPSTPAPWSMVREGTMPDLHVYGGQANGD
ncbi:N6-adenosine-methyltransferase non-catalytic subunit MTB-like [Rutidosis leptorrhynchoides]|uniref:N6-adenosine-methyltransferase non-catalytic subunit MTB-like n=1 Tax=Rutidosis leptorrhynchoides TaxID=125765 RepID=UPI003A9A037D